MEILPVNREWAHTYLLQPFLEGAARITRAWQGVTLHSQSPTPLSLKQRAISWLIGMALMIPVINVIIWIAWQTFGSPETLSDRYCPEENSLVEVLVQPPVVPILPANPEEAKIPERFAFQEAEEKGSPVLVQWTITPEQTKIETKQTCPQYTYTSTYTPNWEISEFSSMETGKDPLYIKKLSSQKLLVTKGQRTPQEMNLKKDLPWIQQPTLGFRNFILSQTPKLHFYFVFPRLIFSASPYPMEMMAEKKGLEHVPGQGDLQKVILTSVEGLPYDSYQGELWFDPKTGLLRKFIRPGIRFLSSEKVGEFVPQSLNSQLP